jgi:hypothetical protein
MPQVDCLATDEEIVRRGEEIYEREIRSKVEEANRGKFLILDVQTGAYEIDEDDLAASERLLDRHPDAELYGLRIGFPAAYRMGIPYCSRSLTAAL